MTDEVLNVCFHGIGRPGRPLDPGEAPYWVTQDSFLRLLDAVAGWPGEVALSFDDGNASDVEVALPALVDRGLAATFFVLAGRFDQPGSLETAQVRELVGAGMVVGNHGMVHRSWRGMDGATAAEELITARDLVASVVGAAVTQAACPFGEYDRGALAGLRAAGYDTVFTSDRRFARRSAWVQPRFSVMEGESPESLLAEVRLSRTRRERAVRSAKGLVKRWR